jgi:hypothetical protein
VAQTCGDCGSEIGAGDAFCGQCGMPVAPPLSAAAPESPVRPDQTATIVTSKSAAAPDAAGPAPARPDPAVTPPDGLPVPGGAGSWPRAEDEPAPPGRPVWPAAPGMGQAATPPYQAEQDYGAPQAGQGAARPGNSSSVPIGIGAERARARPAPDGGGSGDGGPGLPGFAAADYAASDAIPQVQGSTEVEMIGRGNFDPLFNRWYFQQILRQAAIFAGIWFLVVPVSAALFLLIGLGGGTSGAVDALNTWSKLITLFSIALAILYWLVPVPALLSQRSKLIGNEGDAADLVYQHVVAAFNRHQTPLDLLQERPLHPPGEGRRNYLELRHSYFTGYISCFAHGRDLYVGWTFWIRLSPLRWMLMRIGRKFQEYTGRGSDVYQTLRFESARATVAALQSAVEEGTASATAELRHQDPHLAGPANVVGLDID